MTKNKITFLSVYKIVLLLAVFVFLNPLIVFAQGSSTSDVISKINTEVPKQLLKYNVPGASVAFIDNDEIVYNKGFGVKNIITGQKVDDNTFYEAGSNGKMLAAYICLKLAGEGKIKLDEPVVNYIKTPWISDGDRSKKITVRQLLSHTSGLSNSIELIMDKKIHFEPGTKYFYSGVGYTYLQKIIENVTGKSFEEIAKEYIFSRIKMTSSSFRMIDNSELANPHMDIKSILLYLLIPFILAFAIIYILGLIIGILFRFKYYSKKRMFIASIIMGYLAECIIVLVVLSKLLVALIVIGLVFFIVSIVINAIFKKYYLAFGVTMLVLIICTFLIHMHMPLNKDIIRVTNPAFSLKTTSMDMGRFVVELLKDYRSENKILKSMFVEQISIDKNNSWGLGIGIEKDENAINYWHSGINPGFQSLVVLDAKNNRGIVILTNSDNGIEFAKYIARVALSINGTWEIPGTG